MWTEASKKKRFKYLSWNRGTQGLWILMDCIIACKGSLQIQRNIWKGRLWAFTSERARLLWCLSLIFLSAPLSVWSILFSSSESDANSSDRYSFTVCQPNSLLSATLMAFMFLDTIPSSRRLSLCRSTCSLEHSLLHQIYPAPQACDQAAVNFLFFDM